jgi:GT2 family glycosyltransferase
MRAWVVVPVYNAADAVAACLDQLRRTLGADHAVLLADDASPDPRIPGLLQAFAEAAPCPVRLHRRGVNGGFVANVIEAVALLPGADVVLLNSDTLPAAGWLDALLACAASDPRIATVTPWSNNAEICSWPQLCRAAPLPDAAELAALGHAAARLRLPPLDLPTGVGFAMYVRRAAWDALGGFDAATFGRGYGEENDFCQRAAAHGWRNVFCPQAYVGHAGNASFAELGLRAGGENLRRLEARYPRYGRAVADFIAADPMAPYRAALDAALRGGPAA